MGVGPRFGAHMSIAGGLHRAIEIAVAAGCECLQIFVKNQRQWQCKGLSDDDVDAWRKALDGSGIGPVVAHSTYLINLASPEREIRSKSIDALVDEVERCSRLGLAGLVLHPGAHVGAGEAEGLKRIHESLARVMERTTVGSAPILLETTAGQGSALGYRFEHLAELIDKSSTPDQLGVCLDTCHVFAAGYDLRAPEMCRQTIDEFDGIIGLRKLVCIHCNDSKKECGSRVDRHEHVGKGMIGRVGFKTLVNDARLADVPFILETPKGEDSRGRDLDRVNLSVLHRMRNRAAGGRASSAGLPRTRIRVTMNGENLDPTRP